jgi:hypothetical protein
MGQMLSSVAETLTAKQLANDSQSSAKFEYPGINT